MSSLQQQQAPIDAAIVKAMISSTPDNWKSVRLVLERKSGASATGELTHEISSPEGHAPVVGDMSLFDATYNLDALVQANGARLRRAEYLAHMDGSNWAFTSTFEYEDKKL